MEKDTEGEEPSHTESPATVRTDADLTEKFLPRQKLFYLSTTNMPTVHSTEAYNYLSVSREERIDTATAMAL
jgi:hypothetical protein